nr:RHS repeat protein [Escherichia coli]EKL5580843.1 RHS repeat protein [Escherichia coli]EKY5923195.1 RHS repeat protein [Escherichia coli]ELN5949734.1 RHS repeat protein [Escherichia coli]EMA0523145.1 RHS repeat protein [Escherichia coli]
MRCILPPEDERDRHPDESLLKTTYRYNAAGELTEVILPGDETLTFSRDEAGREVFRHSNRGFACEQGWNAASLSPSAPDFSRRKPHGAGCSPHWYGSTVTTARAMCRLSPAGKITDGKHGGSTGWTGTARSRR